MPRIPPVHSQFKPGQSGNPDGARKHDKVTRALRTLTIETYKEVIELVLTENLDGLKTMILDKKTPALQVGVAKAFLMAIHKGDYAVIERIAERIIGKIPDQLQVHSQNMNLNLNATLDKELVKAALAKLESDV